MESGKLEDSWDRPYEIYRRCNYANYELAIPHRKTKRKIVHVNHINHCVPQEACVYRIVVATEDSEVDLVDKTRLRGVELTGRQKQQLEELLAEFSDVLDDKPGCKLNLFVHCPTGFCPAWRGQAKDELDALLKGGIIEPSTGPWSFPIFSVGCW